MMKKFFLLNYLIFYCSCIFSMGEMQLTLGQEGTDRLLPFSISNIEAHLNHESAAYNDACCMDQAQQSTDHQKIRAENNVRFSTLNFNFEDAIVSGAEGNIEIWTPLKTDPLRKEYFDVDKIHADLATYPSRYENRSQNAVAAAFTVIIRKKPVDSAEPQFYAVTKVIEENGNAKIWLSGELAKKDKREFFEGLKKRIGALTECSEPESDLVRLIEQISKHQNDFHDKFVENILQLIEANSTMPMRSIMDLWEGLLAAKNRAESSHIMDFSDNHSLADLFDPTEKSVGSDEFGPMVDSEQFLLSELEQTFVSDSTENCLSDVSDRVQAKGLLPELLTKYTLPDFKEKMQTELSAAMAAHLASITNSKTPEARMIPSNQVEYYNRLLEEFEQFFASAHDCIPVGCIAHIHSTNEFCEYCAASFTCECYKREDNFVSRCKTYMKKLNPVDTPFFAIFGSYGKELRGGVNEWRLPGTISGRKYREAMKEDYKGERIDLRRAIDGSQFPLFHIPAKTVSRSTCPIPSKTIQGIVAMNSGHQRTQVR